MMIFQRTRTVAESRTKARITQVFSLAASILATTCACQVALAEDDPCASELPVSAQAVIQSAEAPESLPPNLNFTPLMLRQTAQQRGISLSGQARLYELSPDQYRLSGGCVFMQTNAPMRIDTCRCSIFAAAGSAIVVHVDKNVTTVLNLHDRKQDSVRVVFGKNYLSLNPGEELGLMGSSVANPEQVAAGPRIGFRRTRVLENTGDMKVVLLEFSLADALKHCKIFRQLKQSPFEIDHKLLSQIVKTAAAINTMYAKSREAYGHGEKPPVSKPGGELSQKKAGTQI